MLQTRKIIFFIFFGIIYVISAPKVFAFTSTSCNINATDLSACSQSGGEWNPTDSSCVCPSTGAAPSPASGQGAVGNVDDNCGGDPKLEKIDGVCQFKVSCTAGSFACAKNLSELIGLIVKYLLLFSGVIAVLFIIVGGFWYLTAAGNEEQAEKGQKALTNAIIGLVIVIMSYVIVSVVVNALSGNIGK